ncbi:hypothetical protein KSP40_PGU008582 [Platanthera guangdongensis]|uniref:Dirigent protein n=1 Tax=Platanthera guangdongensis TaxID=2320717 RepID=A0ABR2N205_9ASPA
MLGRIVFFASIIAAALVVLVLAFVPPPPQKRTHHNNHSQPWLSLMLYFHPLPSPRSHKGAFGVQNQNLTHIFRYKLTEGKKNTSQVVGEARSLLVPSEHADFADFNMIYLMFDPRRYSGSLCIEARKLPEHDGRELVVVGGTGFFAFARGVAAMEQTRCVCGSVDVAFWMKIRIRIHRD